MRSIATSLFGGHYLVCAQHHQAKHWIASFGKIRLQIKIATAAGNSIQEVSNQRKTPTKHVSTESENSGLLSTEPSLVTSVKDTHHISPHGQCVFGNSEPR